MFTHLNTHSYYSLLRGTASPEALCQAAKNAGFEALALTDTNGLYGLVLFLEAAKEAGIRPIVGGEIRSAIPSPAPDRPALKGRAGGFPSPVNRAPGAPFRGLEEFVAPSFRAGRNGAGIEHATLLVKSPQGYANLCRIISDWHLNEAFDLVQELRQYGDGLVILAGSLDLAQDLRGQVEDLYMELIAGPGSHDYVKKIRAMGLQPAATNRVHFLTKDPAEFQLHRLLRAIDLNTTFSRLPDWEIESPNSYLKTAQQMEEDFFFCPEAVENTARIAERCTFIPDFSLVFPQFDGLDADGAFTTLREEAYRGAAKRYGGISNAVRERIEYELDLIKKKNFASIFLVVQDIVKQSPRTCGRGSAAASIISYCLEITHVDPIRHNLFFDRFLNPGRLDPPDIDVDFAWDERDDVLDYVFRKYGTERSAMISNHVTFQLRAAIHEVAKVYGLPESEITAVTKKLSGYWDDFVDDPKTNPALRQHDFSPPWPEILAMAKKLEDIPRHLSVHCGGVVITPGPVWERVPVQRAAKTVNPSEDGRVRLIQWEKDQAEDAGLVKIDLLGNRSLGVIRDALLMIERSGGPKIEFAKWNPIDDPDTQDLIARGDTMGVFYVESPATRLLQKKAKVGDFEHLVIHSSIIRPAANPYINDYLERLHGKPYQPLHPLLGDLLGETFGIMVYQEDVSKAAMALAGFDSSEADELRKILSKKHKQKRLADLQRKFVEGALQRGVSQESIRAIWDMILSFAGYSFCKPHSASFALVSFKSAWLKRHYPAEFMAAVISNQGGYYSTFAYLSECRRLGLEILPPDVNTSEIRCWGRGKQVRLGFMLIKGLSQRAMEAVIEQRKADGAYVSFDDFRRRANLDSSDVRLLIKAGAFDSIEGKANRAGLMWKLACPSSATRPALKDRATISPSPLKAAQELRDQGTSRLPLFDDGPIRVPEVPPYDERTLLQQEKEIFGFLISRHPLELYQERLRKLDLVRSCDLPQHVGKTVQAAGWLITGKIVSTKQKELMEFLTFEDLDGMIETVFFPKTYDRYGHMLSRERPFLLRGRVEEDFGAVTMTVEEMKYI
jgi:error-prone DNA polymerase